MAKYFFLAAETSFYVVKLDVNISVSSFASLLHPKGRQVNKDGKWEDEVFSCLMLDDSEFFLHLTAGQPQGWPHGHPIPISASLSSSSAATGRHFLFGPSVKCWHAQRHIGFHYFHSYESATLDSSRAVMAPPTRTRIHEHTRAPRDPAHLESGGFRNDVALTWAHDRPSFSANVFS